MKAAWLALFLAGCVATPSHTDEFCATASPILVDLSKDKLTPATQKEILAHNHLGVILCGWTPPK